MPRSGGTYTPPSNSWSPAVNGTLAVTADWNALLTDIVAALTQSVSKDGQTVMTGSLDMGGFNLTNVASAAIATITGATIVSPTLSGVPTAPTATVGTNTDQIATTAFVAATAFSSALPAQLGNSGKLLTTDGTNASWTNTPSVASLNGGQIAGLRNKIINGNFGVNQRAKSGTVTLAAGEYGHDRWKGGASGCTYTFATSNNVTTLTISAGSLQQVIEGANLQSGTHTLSWSGTAQGKIGAGSYSASGVTGSATGGNNLTIEFNTGTLALVQLEPGSFATPFEMRPIGMELALCQRYYYRLQADDTAYAFGAVSADSATRGYATGTFPVQMRTNPSTFEQSGTASHYTARTGGIDRVCSAVPALTATSTYAVWIVETTVASGQTAGQAGPLIGTSTSAFLAWSAEL